MAFKYSYFHKTTSCLGSHPPKPSLLVKFLFIPIAFTLSVFLLSPQKTYSPHRKLYGSHSILYTEITPPGVIVKPEYGQGNQLFRYACSYALSQQLRIPLYLQVPPEVAANLLQDGVDSSRDSLFKSPLHRSFILDQFHIPLNHLITPFTRINAPSSSVLKFDDELLFNTEEIQKYKEEFKSQGSTEKLFLVHDDFCESEIFFADYKDKIKEMFKPKLISTPSKAFLKWQELILSFKQQGFIPVGIHIRRGDFVTIQGDYWATPISFFQEAVNLMNQKLRGPKVTFFVFSDDINYVKEHLFRNKSAFIPKSTTGKGNSTSTSNMQVYYVSGGEGLNVTSNLEEFILMTLSSHMIISNSTFSWWAAYLIPSSKKVIIAPKFHPKFFDHYKSHRTRAVKRYTVNKLWYPPEWIVLDPYKTNSSLPTSID